MAVAFYEVTYANTDFVQARFIRREDAERASALFPDSFVNEVPEHAYESFDEWFAAEHKTVP